MSSFEMGPGETVLYIRAVYLKKKGRQRGFVVGLKQITKSCMDLLFPQVCVVCDGRLSSRYSTHFCESCGPLIRYLTKPYCRVCGLEVYGDEGYQPLCGECLSKPLPYGLARSVVYYGQEVRQLVHKLKYGRDQSVLPGIREMINSYNLQEFADIDCVVAVPLHLSRLRKRGFNQAAVLARLFFGGKEGPIHGDWLVRGRNTVPQTQLDSKARRKNLQGAFKARSKNCFEGATVCLVDDVFTTGTTVKECSKVIMANRAKKVKVLTLARVMAPKRSGRL